MVLEVPVHEELTLMFWTHNEVMHYGRNCGKSKEEEVGQCHTTLFKGIPLYNALKTSY
jgi:hypothetical protein